jgi:hypothetical protein
MSMTEEDEYNFRRSMDIASGNDPYAAVMDGSHFRIPFTKWLEGMMPGLKSHVRFAKYREYVRIELLKGLEDLHSLGLRRGGIVKRAVKKIESTNTDIETAKWFAREDSLWISWNWPFYRGSPKEIRQQMIKTGNQLPPRHRGEVKYLEAIGTLHMSLLKEHGIPITDLVKSETVRFMVWRKDQDAVDRSAKASAAAKSRHSRKKIT